MQTPKAGGIRPCSLAFGADQLDQRNDPNNENNSNRVLEKFFSSYFAATAVSVVIAFTGIVYVQDHARWKVGLVVPALLMFLSALLCSALFSCFSVSISNRRLLTRKKDSNLSKPTDKLRLLNKACIIKNPEDITADGVASNESNPWSLCSVDQVEGLKALVRVFPLWSAGIMMSIHISQGSFQLLQAKSTDRHITSSFQYPAGSFVSAIVEHVRRNEATSSGFLDNPGGVVAMSAMWLVPQHFLNGMAEVLNSVGQTEFFYCELPKSMSSVAASAMAGLGLAAGNLLASFILSTVDNVT
ncbi:hypothetical protein RHGRI_025000 [Rhododendron griersonianum]|uniref:Uncharacterized protein n=1 Tax=Rhododendron griersonianum TaxID=479676 RepID=A0AAV6J977_9ERIC|nr:hypothetical protein RHGRI_025000 [Rhododendron griersonianum]